MFKDKKSFIVKSSVYLLLLTLTFAQANDTKAKEIINNKCTACHSGTLEKGLSRISDQRKSPEGWEMTISRMQMHNGLSVSSDEKRAIVKYLSKTQGLAPVESEKYRYILEKTPNIQEEAHDPLFTEMCARCHSAARVGLQKRTEDEWSKLVHFHLGQYPTLEYQALARDREWFELAQSKMVPFLSENYAYDNKAWKEWKKADIPTDASGDWTIFGETLGSGAFHATLSLKSEGDDQYSVTLKGKYTDGRPVNGSGKAIIFSKYEYRASLNINETSYRQVFTIDMKNKTLKGRMYQTIHPEEGSIISGAHSDTEKIIAVHPKSIKTGNQGILRIVGTNLSDNVTLPAGLEAQKTIKQDKNEIVLQVSAKDNAENGSFDISVGKQKAKSAIAIYNQIDGIQIVPSYAIARVGDGGGLTPKRHAIFQAYGFSAGKDKKIGTDDDIALGKVDVKWRIEPFDEQAKANKDVSFVGLMDPYSGRFVPSFAGPNPKRPFSTNNAGNIKVVGSLEDNGKVVEGDSHMIVTIQKWVNSPID